MPFSITAPGTYVLTGNLTFTSFSQAGISISTAIAGPVVRDFKGFTVTGDGNAILIGVISPGVSNTYPITIRNGTIQNGTRGVGALANTSLADIAVKNMVFNDIVYQGGAAVEFEQVSSSTISNCTFNNVYYGIFDGNSPGGNSYNNNSFTKTIFMAIAVGPGSNLLTLDRCQFAAPPSN